MKSPDCASMGTPSDRDRKAQEHAITQLQRQVGDTIVLAEFVAAYCIQAPLRVFFCTHITKS